MDQGESVGEQCSDSDSDSETQKPQVRALMFKEKERINKVFQTLIESSEMVTLAKIRQCLQIDRNLKPLTSLKRMDKKLADRVWSLQAKGVPVR